MASDRQTNRQTDGHSDSFIPPPPQTFFFFGGGGGIIKSNFKLLVQTIEVNISLYIIIIIIIFIYIPSRKSTTAKEQP